MGNFCILKYELKKYRKNINIVDRVIDMFKKYNWQQPIYKNDLLNVLLNGLLSAILGGILAGILDYLFGEILNLPISFGLIIICYMVGLRMRKGYYSFHILYPVLSIFFMMFALIFSEFAFMFCIFPQASTFQLLISGKFYLNVILGPVYYIIECFKSFQILYLILGILNFIIYIFAFRICYKIVKGRN